MEKVFFDIVYSTDSVEETEVYDDIDDARSDITNNHYNDCDYIVLRKITVSEDCSEENIEILYEEGL